MSHFSHSFQSFENKLLNDVPFFISGFALFCHSEEENLRNYLGNLDSRSGQCSKVNSAFHPADVDQMRTRNSWGLSGKK